MGDPSFAVIFQQQRIAPVPEPPLRAHRSKRRRLGGILVDKPGGADQ